MTDFKITRGFDIPINGEAHRELEVLPAANTVAILPADFHNIKPKLLVQENDTVSAGSPLFFDKQEDRFKFCSPISGIVKNIHYGERRKIEKILIERTDNVKNKTYKTWTLKELENADPDEIMVHLLNTGLWPLLRERPFYRIARPDKKPKSIFISLTDTAPLAADPLFLIQGKEELFKAGLSLLKKFTDGKIHICGKGESDLEQSLHDVEKHVFTGPHPSGNPGIHIHHIDPINRGDFVWVVRPDDLVMILSFLTTGQYPETRRIALAGVRLSNPRYVELTRGAALSFITDTLPTDNEFRIIGGNILTGTQKSKNDFTGYYDNLITILPENRERIFLGWIAPGLKNFSFSKTFLSALFPKKKYEFDSGQYGGHRAFIQTGLFEQVVPMDIYPDYLIRSILAEDIPEMEALGLYEVDVEDLALCSYIDPSKNDVNAIIRHGLDLLEREG